MTTRTRRKTRSWRDDEASVALLIVWLGIAACAIAIYCWAQQYHRISVWQGAEDDCYPYHGAYELLEVEPVVADRDPSDGVWCRYGSAF